MKTIKFLATFLLLLLWQGNVLACNDISPVTSGGTASCNNCGGWYGSANDWAGSGSCAQNNDSAGYCTRDFGSSKYITTITYSGDCSPHSGCKFSLQGSNDGSSWTTLHGGSSTGSGTYTVNVNNSYRYIKQNKTGNRWFTINLLQVCSNASVTPISACGSSSGKPLTKAPTSGLCNSGTVTLPSIRANAKDCWNTMCPNAVGCTYPDRNWHWYCGNTQCHATDPNASYKGFFGASEIESYSGSFPYPDTVTV